MRQKEKRGGGKKKSAKKFVEPLKRTGVDNISGG